VLCCVLACFAADRLFTTGEVGVAASAHIPDTNYSAVVQKALEMPGFSHEPEPKFVTVGFGHQTTLGAAGGGRNEKVVVDGFVVMWLRAAAAWRCRAYGTWAAQQEHCLHGHHTLQQWRV
jgi:hypothetical protein